MKRTTYIYWHTCFGTRDTDGRCRLYFFPEIRN